MAVRQRAEAPGRCPFRGDILNQTNNYQLSQWDSDDRILRTDFNADNAKVDAALADQAAAIREEADTRNSAISNLSSQIAAKGNCQIYFTTYTGNGTCDEAGAQTLTFPHKPLVVFITETDNSSSMVAVYGAPTVYARATGAAWNRATWGDRTFTWYSNSPANQLNESGEVYNVVALMSVED